jgi:Trk K+ transport system NAD-binding subunit
VIIDEDEERIKALQLRNYNVPMPGLYADASVPKHLLEAGVMRPNCKAIVAITNNEEVNLRISTTARVLNPNIKIITMSKIDVVEDTLANLGGEVHIVDPFKTFAHVLSATMRNPGFYALNKWLSHARKGDINYYVKPPLGKWVICGFGRMGGEVASVLNENGVDTTIIDPNAQEGHKYKHFIVGRTTSKTLVKAKIEEAVGILASTDDDGKNLGILLNARSFNPDLFTIARQNHHYNEVTFAKSGTDIIMQPTLVTAQKILFLLIAPLLKSFFSYLLEKKAGRSQEMDQVINNLKATIGDNPPYLTSLHFTHESSKAVMQWLERGQNVLLGDLLRNPDNRDRALEVVVFVIKSGDKIQILPQADYRIKAGDEVLFCATKHGERLFHAIANNEYKLYYTQTGLFLPRSWIAQGIVRFMKQRK